jgi:integrase
VALELSLYNRQTHASKKNPGKTYIGYVCVWSPGQSGRLSDADQRAPFYIRDQRGGKQWIRLEARTITEAKDEAKKAQDILQAESKGLTVAESQGLKDENRLTTRILAYLEEVEANKSKGTYAAYNRSLELFKESCHRLHIGDVKREDLLAFKTFLKKQDMSDRSVYNHFLNTMIFLKWCKLTTEVKKTDWPPKPEREPEEYYDDEIDKLLKRAAKTFRGIEKRKGDPTGPGSDDRLLLNSFLCSGLRDGEMAHLTYGEIDPRHSLWSVRSKDGHNLKTKESQRQVPVPAWLTKKIMEKRAAEKKTDEDLIFPNTLGQPDEHLLRILQRIAEDAGVTGRVDNHKFRSTAITWWLRNGTAWPDVMRYVGHASPTTILRYAAKVNLQKPEHREKVTQPFNQYATVGD